MSGEESLDVSDYQEMLDTSFADIDSVSSDLMKAFRTDTKTMTDHLEDSQRMVEEKLEAVNEIIGSLRAERQRARNQIAKAELELRNFNSKKDGQDQAETIEEATKRIDDLHVPIKTALKARRTLESMVEAVKAAIEHQKSIVTRMKLLLAPSTALSTSNLSASRRKTRTAARKTAARSHTESSDNTSRGRRTTVSKPTSKKSAMKK